MWKQDRIAFLVTGIIVSLLWLLMEKVPLIFQQYWWTIFIIAGMLMVLFSKQEARAAVRAHTRIAKFKGRSDEEIRQIEQIGYRIFEIASKIVGVIFILGGLSELVKFLRGLTHL